MIKEEIIIYYDKDCPFCDNYTRFLKIKDSFELILKNARENINEIKSLTKLDINDGFIVVYKNSIFQGAKALEFLNIVVDKSTILGKLHFLFKYNNIFSISLYKIIFLFRNITLYFLGKTPKI